MNGRAIETKFINKLVMDCITFRFKPEEALQYIKDESGHDMTPETYHSKRSRLQRKGTQTSKWLNYFTRVGFVEQHKQLMDDALKVQDDRMKQFGIETHKPKGKRNELTISRINADIALNIRLITDLMDSTPIVASIKARILQEEREGQTKQDVPKIPQGIIPNRSTTDNPDAWTIP